MKWIYGCIDCYRGGFESETDTEEFEKIGQGGMNSKPGSFDGSKSTTRQKQLEVGASRSVSPASSASTNLSPSNSRAALDATMTRSSSSSEPGSSFQIPSLTTSEKPLTQLSPLTECAENSENSPLLLHLDHSHYHHNHCNENRLLKRGNEEPISLSPNSSSSLLPMTRPVMCDGQQRHEKQQLEPFGSGGTSPTSLVLGANDFMGTEYYMDESLPSSLSEHPIDGQHQAMVSLLQVLLDTTHSYRESFLCSD